MDYAGCWKLHCLPPIELHYFVILLPGKRRGTERKSTGRFQNTGTATKSRPSVSKACPWSQFPAYSGFPLFSTSWFWRGQVQVQRRRPGGTTKSWRIGYRTISLAPADKGPSPIPYTGPSRSPYNKSSQASITVIVIVIIIIIFSSHDDDSQKGAITLSATPAHRRHWRSAAID